jgi:competence protein ComEC
MRDQDGPPAGSRDLPGLLFWEILFCAFGLGLFLPVYPASAAAALVLAWLLARGGLRRFEHLLFAACFLLGAAWTAAWLPAAPGPDPAWLEQGGKLAVHGIVAEVEPRDAGRINLYLQQVAITPPDGGPEFALPGRLLLAWDWPSERPGPGREVRGRLRVLPVGGFRNPGTWDYDFYRARQGVFHRAYARGDKELALGPSGEGQSWRLRERLRRAVQGPDAPSGERLGQGRAVLLALLLGDRSLLDPETTDLFRAASLSHSLALSGLHLGFVCGLGFALAWLVGRLRPQFLLSVPRPRLGVLLALPLALGYLWLGGATPSLVRSFLMFASWGLLLLLGRGRVAVDGLFLALAAILLVSPLSAFDLRLQFSALAVAGIIALVPPAVRRIEMTTRGRAWRGLALAVGGLLATSLAANLVLAPVMAWDFGDLPVNLLPNLFWLPVLGLVVLPAGLVGLALAVLPATAGLGQVMLAADATVVEGCLKLLSLAQTGGLLPSLAVLRPAWPALLGHLLLLLLAAGLARFRPRTALVAANLGLCLLFAPALERGWDAARDQVRLTLLDTGQSQAVLVEAPGGVRMLVDGGGSLSRTFDLGRAVTGPALTANRPPRLDLVVLSHQDADHAQGLVHVLQRFRVVRFAGNGRQPDGRLGEEFSAALAAGRLTPEVWAAGEVHRLGQGLDLEVLHPAPGGRLKNPNDTSLALRLVWRGRGLAVLCGDLERPGLEDMLSWDRDLAAEVLVLPHHGAESSLVPELFGRVAPALALAAAGQHNAYGFPGAGVRAELARRGIPLWTTGASGALRVTFPAGGLAQLTAADQE